MSWYSNRTAIATWKYSSLWNRAMCQSWWSTRAASKYLRSSKNPILTKPIFNKKLISLSNTKKFKTEKIEWANAKGREIKFDEIFVNVKIFEEHVSTGKIADFENYAKCYTVKLLPTVTLCNSLPYPVDFHVSNHSQTPKSTLKPGESVNLLSAAYDSTLYFELRDYLFDHWYASVSLKKPKKEQEYDTIGFRSCKQDMTTLGLFYTMKDDTFYVSIYAPYWLLNKTTLPLEYKFSTEDRDRSYDINEFSSETPVLLKCNSQTFFSKKTVRFFEIFYDKVIFVYFEYLRISCWK